MNGRPLKNQVAIFGGGGLGEDGSPGFGDANVFNKSPSGQFCYFQARICVAKQMTIIPKTCILSASFGKKRVPTSGTLTLHSAVSEFMIRTAQELDQRRK